MAGAIALVPDEWLGQSPELARASYRDYLCARLEAPRLFLEETEAARGS